MDRKYQTMEFYIRSVYRVPQLPNHLTQESEEGVAIWQYQRQSELKIDLDFPSDQPCFKKVLSI